MDNTASSTRPCLTSQSFSRSAESSFDDCFESIWHYDCVLSPQPFQTSPKSPLQTSTGSSDCLRTGRPSVDEGFPCIQSTHRLQCLFQTLDENHDGYVSVDELNSLLGKFGKEESRSYLVSFMEPLHGNDEMVVNFAEFTVLYQSIFGRDVDTHQQEEEEKEGQIDTELDSEELLDAFNVYDKNRDGYICASELAAVLRDLGFPEGNDLKGCQALINRVDNDGNGLIDLQEFKEMLWRGCGISETPTRRSNQTLIDKVDTDDSELVDLRECDETLRRCCGVPELPTTRSCTSEAMVDSSKPGFLLPETEFRIAVSS